MPPKKKMTSGLTKSPSNSKYKQLPITSFSINSIATKECNPKTDTFKSKRLTRRNNTDTNSNIEPVNSTSKVKSKTISKTKAKPKKEIFKRNTSGSFEKYGVCLPNFEDVLKYQKTIQHDKKIIANLANALSLPLEVVKVPSQTTTLPEVALDCKDLTDEELLKLYSKNIKHIEGIVRGTTYSKRHQQFINEKHTHTDNFTVNDLRYNLSMVTFTYEQKELLLSCLCKEFNTEHLCKNDQYFFKVLLPELCLKIFMNVYDMSEEVAINYLQKRPADQIL